MKPRPLADTQGHLLVCWLMLGVAASLVAGSPSLEGKSNLEENLRKLKRDSRAKVTTLELDSQESFIAPSNYHHLPPPPPPPPPPPSSDSDHGSDYGHDSAKNSFAKQAADWSLYDQGNNGQYDKHDDKGWSDSGHDAYSNYGKHHSYGNRYGNQGSGQGSGYYSRDRGYGYEKHYSYDKEVASKHYSDNHNQYGAQQALYDQHGAQGSHGHSHYGHDRHGQLSRYGGQLYAKRGAHLGLNHDYGRDHQHLPPVPPTHQAPVAYPHFSGVPTYRSTHPMGSGDYQPQQHQVDYSTDANYASIHPGSYLNYY